MRNELLFACLASATVFLAACAPATTRQAADEPYEEKPIRTGSHVPQKDGVGRTSTTDSSAHGDLQRVLSVPGGVGGIGIGGTSN